MGDDRLWADIDAFLSAEDVELDDLDLRGRGRGRILRVVVDAPGGIGVDRIADISRGLSRLLDDEDPIDGPFTLEVSSPGLERDLKRPAHFRKAVGREVVVKTGQPVDGDHSHRGILDAVSESDVSVRIGDQIRVIPFDDVTGARTVFRLEPKPKPGHK
jgi:ribosome maturation factor RimP